MSLISSALKTEIDSVFDEVHDTFKQDIYLYIKEKVTIPVNSGYNPLYDRNTNIPSTPLNRSFVKQTISARVYYPDRGLEHDQRGINVADSVGRVRVKVAKSDFEIMKGAEKIEVDDVLYTIAGDPHLDGAFSTLYAVVYLERIS